MQNVALELQNVSKAYQTKGSWSFENDRSGSDHVSVLSDISLAIKQAEILVLLGPSGSGKSTLLRIMSGLDQPTTGSVKLGKNLTASDISFVFQQFALLPWLSIRENVGLGLTARHIPRRTFDRIVERELKLFGLLKFAHAYPRTLSGGMRQRVGIARALATDPKIIFMDEPFSELDSFTATELRRELLEIWRLRKPTIVMVTHLIEEAILLSSRIAVLTPRPGRIERVLANPLPRPRDRRSPEFFALEDKLTALVKP